MIWESFGVVGMRIAKPKSAYNSLIIKRPTRDACLFIGGNQAPHFVFYPTALNGCWGIVFTHGVRMVRRAAGRAVDK